MSVGLLFCFFSHYVCEEEESGSEEETLQYYTPAELGYRNRRKKRSKMQPKNSQSLFSIVLSVNHGLLSLHTHLKVLHQHRKDSASILSQVMFHVMNVMNANSSSRMIIVCYKKNMVNSGWR